MADTPTAFKTNIPPAVRAQRERADQLMREQLEHANTPPGNEPPAQPPAEPKKEPPAEPKKEPPAEPKKEPPAEPKPQDNPADDDAAGWKRKFEAANGRAQSEARKVQEQISEIANLRQIIATMEAPQPAGKESSFKAEKLITPEEEAEYGPQFLAVVEKKAQELVAPKIHELNEKIAQLDNRVKGINENTRISARQQMMNKLDTDVPKWKEQNEDPGFLEWLKDVDPYSGQQRGPMLQQAWERNDTSRVLAFFQGYLREAAIEAPRAEEPRPPAEEPRSPLERYAAPGRAKPTASQSAPDTKAHFTRAQIQHFYRTKPSDYTGGEAERKALEKKIFEAVREGRVTG